ncbi:MAG TPA: hypothetical protein VNS81_08775 [Nocardioides sp.]|nr:hypothetical protein [Nocardioides sp.]
MIPLHIGADHPAAAGAAVVLAFGPFILLAGVIVWRRHVERDEDGDAPDDLG